MSSDDSRIISGSDDTSIKIWDVASGVCIQTLDGHKRPVTSVCISSDTCYVASGSSDNTVKVWDVASGRCLHTLIGHTNNVNSVYISWDGRYVLSGAYDKTMRLWDLLTDSAENGAKPIVSSNPASRHNATTYFPEYIDYGAVAKACGSIARVALAS